MVVHTESEAVVEARRIMLDLLLSDHPQDCLICEKAGDCLLQEYCYRYGVERDELRGRAPRASTSTSENRPDRARPEQVHPLRQVRARLPGGPGHQRHRLRRARLRIDGRPPRSTTRSNTDFCRFCGQCVDICPTGALANKQLKGTRTLGPQEGAHHLPVLRRGLQLRPERRRRQGRRRHGHLRRAGQRGLAVRQGPLPHRPHQQPRPHHHAAHQARRRLRGGELGRGARPGRRASSSRSRTATAPTPSPCSARRAAPTKRTTCCSGSRGRA